MQNKIQVEVSVKFESGATITLAKDQHEAVVYFINHMLFGETPKKEVKETRKYTKRRVHNRWTEEEKQMVREAMKLPQGKQRRDAYKQIARNTRRSQSSISNIAWLLRKESKVAITGGQYKPLHSLAGLLN